MTIKSFRRVSALHGRRCGMTLIEIMAAIMVLAIGLVGVLAAIPFGGLRLAQMNEADNSSLLGKNAVRLIKANGWADPNNWYIAGAWNAGLITTGWNKKSVHQNGNLNLKYPFVLDPLSDVREIEGPGSGRYLPDYREIDLPADRERAATSVFYTKVSPALGYRYEFLGAGGFAYLANRYDRIFYLQDDLASGFDESEDDTHFRPFLETEADMVLGKGVIPAFTGRYSWMATVYPKANADPFHDCRPEDISSADYDVIVFRDRVMNDERIMKVTVEGTGYQGGTVTLNFDSMCNNGGVPANDAIDRGRVVDQLASTKYIMLMGPDIMLMGPDIMLMGPGPDDIPRDGDTPMFARWYQIANYSVDAVNNPPEYVKMSLIGPDTPRGWGGATVSGVFFPGVIGVYSGSTSF
jgi:prepilin-type N-terminal cleavage/methylation domain-containing protein